MLQLAVIRKTGEYFMQYWFFVVFCSVATTLASDLLWDRTDQGKNAYTRTLYSQHQKDIETLAVSTFQKPVHPFYQMLFWVQHSSVKDKLEQWLVQHLLNTAGHWGWAKDKTASNCETNIYYEVGLCQLIVHPQMPIMQQAPRFLTQIQRDSHQMIQDADDFPLKGDPYFRFRVLWHAKNGWESAINSRGCLTSYWMICVGINGSLSYGVPMNQDVVPYKDAGAYQMIDRFSLDRIYSDIAESAQRTVEIVSQKGYSTEELVNNEQALHSLLQEVSNRPSRTTDQLRSIRFRTGVMIRTQPLEDLEDDDYNTIACLDDLLENDSYAVPGRPGVVKYDGYILEWQFDGTLTVAYDPHFVNDVSDSFCVCNPCGPVVFNDVMQFTTVLVAALGCRIKKNISTFALALKLMQIDGLSRGSFVLEKGTTLALTRWSLEHVNALIEGDIEFGENSLVSLEESQIDQFGRLIATEDVQIESKGHGCWKKRKMIEHQTEEVEVLFNSHPN